MNKFWSVKNFVNQDGTGQSELILYGDISDTSWRGDEITPREFAEAAHEKRTTFCLCEKSR